MIIHILVTAYDENICVEQKKAVNSKMEAHKFIMLPENQYGFLEDNVTWAVMTWGMFLGVSPSQKICLKSFLVSDNIGRSPFKFEYICHIYHDLRK